MRDDARITTRSSCQYDHRFTLPTCSSRRLQKPFADTAARGACHIACDSYQLTTRESLTVGRSYTASQIRDERGRRSLESMSRQPFDREEVKRHMPRVAAPRAHPLL